MSVDENQIQEGEYRFQFAEECAIEDFIVMPMGIDGSKIGITGRPVDSPERIEWLCDTASKRLSPAQFSAWLRLWRQILDSSDPEVDAETLQRSRSLRVDDTTYTVHWAGKICDLGNTFLFHLMKHLESSTDQFHTFATLNERMGRGSDEKLAHIKSRLCCALHKAEMPDLAKCIKCQPGHYGLFFQPPGCAIQMST